MSLRTRLAVITSLLVVLGVAITGALSFFSTEAELIEVVDDSLDSRAEALVEELREQEKDSRRRADLPAEPGLSFQRLNSDGTVIDRTGPHEIPVSDRDLAVAADRDDRTRRTVKIDGRPHRVVTQYLEGDRDEQGAVQIARSLGETNQALEGLLRRIIVIGAALAVLSALAGWLVARSATRPLRKLTATAEHVSRTEDLSTPIDVERSDEVGRLATSFGSMLAALRRSRDQQQQLIQDAAHEVRTPLTTLRANIELLERAPDIGEPHRSELLQSLRDEFEALTTLFNEVVELATGERDEAPFESLDLDEPAERAARIFVSRTGRTLHERWDGGPVSGNAELLERAISNLLGNADKYSPAGEPVELVVEGGKVCVRDNGPGIPVAERDRIFDRFYRSDEARAMSGSGLGLAIVQQIVERHGGRVFVGDAPGGGAEVGFELPTTTAD